MKSFAVVTLFVISPMSVYAALSFNSQLETAGAFAILGGSTITNTGPTIINGDLGLWPGTDVVGFFPTPLGPGIVNGTIHTTDAVAQQAQVDLISAYTSLAGEPCGTNLSGQDLGGLTLLSGVYCFDSSAQLTGTLTLNAQNQADAFFVIQIVSALTTESFSNVVFTNGGQGSSLYWQVGSSAMIGTSTSFAGNLVALTSITLNTNATISCGRALAINGAVTLDTNVVSFGGCGSSAAIPEPSSALLLLIGLPGLYWLQKLKSPLRV